VFFFLAGFQIQVKDYMQFQFEGAKDIAAMFQFYQQGSEPRDVRITRKIVGTLQHFDKWVYENKQKLAEAMNVPVEDT
jgi:hypothetical protein